MRRPASAPSASTIPNWGSTGATTLRRSRSPTRTAPRRCCVTRSLRREGGAGAMNILVTGGAGFIGSALCRHLCGGTDHTVVNLDKLTYAGNLDSLRQLE